MENKYNCDAYDSGYCYSLGRPLTDEENDMCEDCCCAIELNKEFLRGERMKDEKYYWETKDGDLIPVHELTNLHVCNIVMYFGKELLRDAGHSVIVDRFENLNKEYNFFEKVM